MSKSILLINGSPRKTGMTNALIDIFISKVNELTPNINSEKNIKISAEKIHLVDYDIKHCTACDKCLSKPYKCPISESDDMPKIEKKILNADVIIIGSPSYFANVSGYVKDLIDRSRPLKMSKYKLKDKYFSVLVSSGLRAGGINTVQNVLIQYALIQGMIVVGGLGHPVLMANLPSESGQKFELTDFRKAYDISNVSESNVNSLADRVVNLLDK